MADQNDDPAIQNLSDQVSQCQSEIVILKAAVAALLSAGSVKQQTLDEMVGTAYRRRTGWGDPDGAPDTRAFFKEIISRRSRAFFKEILSRRDS